MDCDPGDCTCKPEPVGRRYEAPTLFGGEEPRFEHDAPLWIDQDARFENETPGERAVRVARQFPNLIIETGTASTPEERGKIMTDTLDAYKRHANSARFHELLDEAGAMHDRKQEDYGKGDDPFANVRASEDWGVDGWVGAMVRLTDKVKRLQSLRTKGYLANESALDSFMDIAVYSLIAYVLYEQAAAEGTL